LFVSRFAPFRQFLWRLVSGRTKWWSRAEIKVCIAG
jgi:hypothetical protein